jgi:hypothetical protein
MYNSYQSQVSNAQFSIGDAGMKLIMICIIGVGVSAYIAYLTDSQDNNKSASWPTVQGTLNEIGQSSIPLPIIGRFMPVSCPSATYTYTVDNKTYKGEKKGGVSLSLVRTFTWHHPEVEVPRTEDIQKELESDQREAIAAGQQNNPEFLRAKFEKRLKSIGTVHYKPVPVRYDRLHPESSVLDPAVLQTEQSQLYTSIILIALGGLALGGTILHGYVTAPVANDPALSLEAALAHQRRRR